MGGQRDKTVVVVSFAAMDGDPYPRNAQTGAYLQASHDSPASWGPVIRVLADPRSSLRGRVGHWYYLCHPQPLDRTGRIEGSLASQIAGSVRVAIDAHLPSALRPSFHVVHCVARGTPHDHGELFEIVRDELRRIRAEHPGSELVLVLSAGSQAMHATLLLAGSVGIVDDPIRLVQVERGDGRTLTGKVIVDVEFKLETVLHVARGMTPARPPADEAPTLAYDQAKSPALVRALEQARRAARVRFPALLRGERGVGKSTLATFIRAGGPFRVPERDGEWPAVACGQFTDAQRLLVELCGSVKGAFTGAETRTGLLALAHKDTLFLDEIHDMSDAGQRVMIRLLEDGMYYPVGSPRPRKSEFRLISGTNLPDAALGGRLSADFYDRIRDIEIWVPPLRECREDLDWMWREQWARVARVAGADPRRLEAQHGRIVDALRRSHLPGNWRDLRRLAVQFAVEVHAEGRVGIATLEEKLRELSLEVGTATRSGTALSKRDGLYYQGLETVLGAELVKLWAAMEGGVTRRAALETLLGDRHRARRADAFLTRTRAGSK